MEYLDILWSNACSNENIHNSYICGYTVLYLSESGRHLILDSRFRSCFSCVSHLWHRTVSAYQNLFVLNTVLIVFRHHLSLRHLVVLRPHLNLHSQRNGRQIKFRECLVPFGSPYFVFASANRNTRKIKTYKSKVLVIVLYGCGTWSTS